MKIKNKKDFVLGVASILISLWIYYLTTTLNIPDRKGDPGPTLFPLIGAGIMFICGLVVLIKPGAQGKAFMTKEQWKSAGIIFGVYVLTAVLFWIFGYMITLPIIIFILTFLFSAQSRPDATVKSRVVSSLIFAIVAGAALYVAYVVGLQAKLPTGLLFDLFG